MFIPWIAIPILVTIVCLCFMFRPLQIPDKKYHGGGSNLGGELLVAMMVGSARAFEQLTRLLWLIPIAVSWALYFGISYGVGG